MSAVVKHTSNLECRHCPTCECNISTSTPEDDRFLIAYWLVAVSDLGCNNADANLCSKHCSRHHCFHVNSHNSRRPREGLEDQIHEQERKQCFGPELFQDQSILSFQDRVDDEQQLFKHIWTYHNALQPRNEASDSPPPITDTVIPAKHTQKRCPCFRDVSSVRISGHCYHCNLRQDVCSTQTVVEITTGDILDLSD